MDRLERAREELQRASDSAGRVAQEQLDSLQEGIFEEDVGDKTGDDPEPKDDRIAEVADKLGGLEEEVEGEGTRDRIENARGHLEAYLAASDEDDDD